jgi:hypothetical protein
VKTRVFYLTLCLLFLILGSRPVFAGSDETIIYHYVDKDGSLVWTQDLSQVPANQRKQAKKDAIDVQNLPEMNVIESPPTVPQPASKGPQEISPQATRVYWQQRVESTQKDLTLAQNDLEQIYTKQRENLLSGPGETQRRLEFSQREKDLKEKIAFLEDQLNNQIPEDARKAGAPPGWIRDAKK